MPTYSITDPDSGMKLQVTGDSPPTEQELDGIFAEARQRQQSAAPQQQVEQGQPSIGELRRREGAGEIAAQQAPLSLTPATDNVVSQSFFESAVKDFGKVLGGGSVEGFPVTEYGTEARAGEMAGAETQFKKVAPSAVRYGVPLLAAPATGGMSLLPMMATEAGIQLASEAGAQAIEGEFKPGQLGAAAIPMPPGAQRATRLGQISTEIGRGIVTGGAMTAAEKLPDLISGKINKTEFLMDVGIGATAAGALTPLISGVARGAGAWARAGTKTPFNSQFLAELNRPYVQQALEDRAKEIEKVMVDAIQGEGIDASFARQITDAYYSPERAGGGIENLNRFDQQVKSLISDTLVKAKRTGLTGDQLAGEMKRVLEQTIGPANKNADQAISKLTGNLDALVSDATDKVDTRISKRNDKIVKAARSVEGRQQLEASALDKKIADLNTQLESLPGLQATEVQNLTAQERAFAASQEAQKAQIKNEISRLQAEKQAFEDITAPQMMFGERLGVEELGVKAAGSGREELELFKKQAEEGYRPLTGALAEIQLEIPRVDAAGNAVLDDAGNQIIDQISVEQLRQKRSKLLKSIKWDKPVQKGDYSLFKQLDDLNKNIEEGLQNHPELAKALADQNAFYREGISRFKSNLADKLLRDIGESGGKPEVIKSIFASGTEFKNLKDFLGPKFDQLLPDLRQYAYTQIWNSDPNKILSTLQGSLIGKEGALAQNVVKELFPDLQPFIDVAKKYNSVISQIAEKDLALKDVQSQSFDLNSKIKDLTKNISSLKETTSQELQNAQSRLKEVQLKISEIQKTKADLLKRTKLASNEEKKAIEQISNLSADIKFSQSKGNYNISDNVERTIRDLGDKNTIDSLEKAIGASNELNSRMNVLVSKAIKPNGELGSFDPSEMVEWLASSSGDAKSVYRINEFMKVLDKESPDLKGDLQDLIVGRMLDESVKGGKINTDVLRQFASPSEKYGPLMNGLFGPGGKQKIDNIARQLDLIQEGAAQKSLFNEKILPLLFVGTGLAAGGLASKAFGFQPVWTTAVGGLSASLGFGYRSKVADASKAAIGKILKNPEYLRIVSKPIDDLTQAELNYFNKGLNDALVTSALRFKSQSENK